MPYFLATAAVESWLPPTSEVTSTPGMRLSASRCFWPNAPWPATQIFMGFLLILGKAFGDFIRRHSGARAQRANPESITTTGSMDSGSRLRRVRNDGTAPSYEYVELWRARRRASFLEPVSS